MILFALLSASFSISLGSVLHPLSLLCQAVISAAFLAMGFLASLTSLSALAFASFLAIFCSFSSIGRLSVELLFLPGQLIFVLLH